MRLIEPVPVGGAQRAFMPEIQGLRALAVGLVVAFHLWSQGVSGGFVGVDVFFVISGYLITSHLMREFSAYGRVRLGHFYAKRMRRLLPASLLVLAVAAAASAVLLPAQLARSTAREVVAASLYGENLWLAGKAVTYSASNDVASPIQHYWSLSTEEQFYLVWPALIMLGAWLGRRFFHGRTLRSIIGVLGVLLAASLVHSIVMTSTDPAAAYFLTTTRAWEFAVGAMTSFVLSKWTPTWGFSVVLRWTGLAAVIVSAALISQATPFPGAVALAPVLGTASVIAAGDTGLQDPLSLLMNARVVQWLGDISYSIYLWHWPLIALLPFALGHPLTTKDKVAVIAVTLVAAHLTRHWVEMPFLKLGRGPHGVGHTFVATAVAMALLAGAGLGGGAWIDKREADATAARIQQLSKDPCLGATATLHREQCHPFTAPLSAPVSEADSPWVMPDCKPGCWTGPRPSRVIAVVGDSHAQNLYHAIAPMLPPDTGIALVLKGGCPLNLDGSDLWLGTSRGKDWCGGWTRDALAQLKDLHPDEILILSYSRSTWTDEASAEQGFRATWSQATQIAPVTVVRDFPKIEGSGPQCLAVHAGDPSACSYGRDEALKGDLAFATATKPGSGVQTLDLTSAFCDETRCYPVVGGLPVYYDNDHITGTFARSLAPLMASKLR